MLSAIFSYSSCNDVFNSFVYVCYQWYDTILHQPMTWSLLPLTLTSYRQLRLSILGSSPTSTWIATECLHRLTHFQLLLSTYDRLPDPEDPSVLDDRLPFIINTCLQPLLNQCHHLTCIRIKLPSLIRYRNSRNDQITGLDLSHLKSLRYLELENIPVTNDRPLPSSLHYLSIHGSPCRWPSKDAWRSGGFPHLRVINMSGALYWEVPLHIGTHDLPVIEHLTLMGSRDSFETKAQPFILGWSRLLASCGQRLQTLSLYLHLATSAFAGLNEVKQKGMNDDIHKRLTVNQWPRLTRCHLEGMQDDHDLRCWVLH
jgi:hypothetical protein